MAYSEATVSPEDDIVKASPFQGLRGEDAIDAIKCCTKLLSCHLDPDTLHSNLRICARLTRNPDLAVIFARDGGPQALLSLTQKSCFRGFSSLLTMIFKHCLEVGQVLRQAMEGVVRAAVNSPFYSSKDVRPLTMGARELNYVLRKLGPCACRNPKLFLDIVSKMLVLCSNVPVPGVYTSHPRQITQVKCVAPTKVSYTPLVPMQCELVNLLIDHLCAESFDGEPHSKSNIDIKGPESKMEEDSEIPRAMRFGDPRRGRVRRGSYRRQLNAGMYDDDDIHSEDMMVDSEETGSSRMAGSLSAPTESSSPTDEQDTTAEASKNERWCDQPLMSKAAILRLLSELVETYPFCAKLISESSRKVQVSGQPAKEMTVLSFIFDYLLPSSYTASGKVPPIAKLAKTFIQSLAVTHPYSDSISLLVTEFKQALNRALSLPESASKHNRIRALTGLLNQISESFMVSKGSLNPSHFARLLIRKGFISDLARAIHSLNLSSSLFPGTANSILKPLEVLTKMVNQVAASGKKAEGGVEDKGPQGESESGSIPDWNPSLPIVIEGAQPSTSQSSNTTLQQTQEAGGSQQASFTTVGGSGGVSVTVESQDIPQVTGRQANETVAGENSLSQHFLCSGVGNGVGNGVWR